MIHKERDWSHFADDFEERNYYVIGKTDVKLILNKVASLNKLKNVLELGCGNGTFSKVLAKNSDSLLVTDLADEMVEASKNRLKSFDNIKVEKANCFDLPYPDNNFDVVFMANLIHIIPNPGNAILQCKRVLKKNGFLIVIDYTQKGMEARYKLGMVCRYFKMYRKLPKGGRNFGLKEASMLIQSRGFCIVESELIGVKSKASFIKATKK